MVEVPEQNQTSAENLGPDWTSQETVATHLFQPPSEGPQLLFCQQEVRWPPFPALLGLLVLDSVFIEILPD